MGNTNICEQFVSFDTAKMLKEAGFYIPCFTQYTERGTVWRCNDPENFNKSDNVYSRPTQALAARWLREVHGIHVIITEEAYTNGINYLWQVLIYNPSSVDCWDDKSTGLYGDNGEYKAHEAALEAGLQEAVKLIKK